MGEKLVRADRVRPGDRVYDNRHPNWLLRWPTVIDVYAAAGERVGIATTGRFFAPVRSEPLLTKICAQPVVS